MVGFRCVMCAAVRVMLVYSPSFELSTKVFRFSSCASASLVVVTKEFLYLEANPYIRLAMMGGGG